MNVHEQTHETMEQYKQYIYTKERFVERNFNTNKFFMIVSLLLFVGIFILDVDVAYNLTSKIIFGLAGLGVTFLWWSNTYTYEILMKIKLKNVIDRMEQTLPFQPHLWEKEGIDAYKKEKGAFFVSNTFSYSGVQKVMAIGMFTAFLVVSLVDIVPYYATRFFEFYYGL